ncbi:hypothetical protein HID58_043097, partial [Brassica napus]
STESRSNSFVCLNSEVVYSSHIGTHGEKLCCLYSEEKKPCDLSVINGYECSLTLRAVEDRYPAWSYLSGVVA